MKIAKLELSKHKQGRWLVWLDDGSLLRMGEGEVVSLALYAGKELSDAEVEELNAAAGQSKVNERALDLLSVRPMSRKELLDKLTAPARRRKKPGEAAQELDPEMLALERERLRQAAEKAADRLEELGLLDDRAYAATLARHYTAKGYGERKVRDELYRRGVPREYWDEALAAVRADESESGGMVDDLLCRKLRGVEPTRENLKKASDYLARRGFGWSEITQAIERYQGNR